MKKQDEKQESPDKGSWFLNLPKSIEGFQKTGQILGLQLVEEFLPHQQPPIEQANHTTKDLLKIFQQKGFTIDKLLKNFYDHFEKRGIHDYLVNKLYTYEEADLNFYMAELW